jgi:hypothetical protein
LYSFILVFLRVFLWSKHIIQNTCNFQKVQMKHQIDATLCRFYFCRVTLHVSGASARHQEYLKLVQRPLVHVFCKNI